MNIGLIGLGGVSEVHLTAYQSVNTARIVAGADIGKNELALCQNAGILQDTQIIMICLKKKSLMQL